MVRFIDDHRADYGVEPICRPPEIAPSTYCEAKAQEADPTRRSARAQRDETLGAEIQRVWQANRRVYGAGKSGSNSAASRSTWRGARSSA